MKPWKLVKEERVYDGYRKIDRRTFTMPNNEDADFDVVQNGADSFVGVVALTEGDKVVIFKTFRAGPAKYMCELPGGAIDEGEDVLVAAHRELLEETGYTADLEHIGTHVKDAYSTGTWHMVIGRNAVKTGEQKLDAEEWGVVILMEISDFKEAMLSKQVSDAGLGFAGLDALGKL